MSDPISRPVPSAGDDTDSGEDGGNARAAWQYLAILSLLAACFMGYQIGLLRELRFQLSTIFTLTPFLFSSVVVFIGLGSIAAHRIPIGSRQFLRWGVALLPLLLLPAFALSIVSAQWLMDHGGSAFSYGPRQGSTAPYMNSVVLAFVASAVIGYGVIFFLQGLIFAAYFAEGRRTGLLSRLYAIDLIASGLAALAGGLLSFVLSPIHLALVSTGLALAALWIAAGYLRLRRWLVVAESALVLLVIALELSVSPVAALEAPSWLGAEPSYSRWSPYRRIDVVERDPIVRVFADGVAFHHYNRAEPDHRSDPRSLAARAVLLGHPELTDVLVVGAGTGADIRVLRDLVPRPLSIVAVELDGGFVDTARAFPWMWEAYQTAQIEVQEGRFFLETTPLSFDVVIYAFIDPQSAISSVGLPDANFLYTDRGLRAAYERVEPGGYLVISRVFFEDQRADFLRRLCATLDAAGVPRVEVGIYPFDHVIGWSYYGNLSVVNVLVHKGGAVPLLAGQAGIPWLEGGEPTTDRYPFSIMIHQWFALLGSYLQDNIAVAVVLGLLLLALLGRVGTSRAHASFFLLGLGSFLVESLILFYSFQLIGNPSLSAAGGVGFLLFWNGVGSMLSDRLERRRWFYVLVPLAVLGYGLTAPLLNEATIVLPVALRTLLFAAHVALPGIIVGAMFPIGLRCFPDRPVSGLYFIDLIGCGLAPLLFWLLLSYAGITSVTACFTAIYALLGLVFYSSCARRMAS